MARRRVPEGAFELQLQVRSYEVGREGRVRPANILRYFEYLATEASTAHGFDHTWYEEHGTAWVVREMRLIAASLPQIGERLRMATWLSGYGRVQAYREYALWREGDARLVARAQGRWAYVDRATGQLRRLPEDLISRFGALGHAMSDLHLGEVPAATMRTFGLSARTYEADSNRHINNAVYMDWVEEGVALALETSPADAAHVAHLRRLHVEYLRPAMPGDQMRIGVGLAHRRRGVMVASELHDERLGHPVVRAQAFYLLPGRHDARVWDERGVAVARSSPPVLECLRPQPLQTPYLVMTSEDGGESHGHSRRQDGSHLRRGQSQQYRLGDRAEAPCGGRASGLHLPGAHGAERAQAYCRHARLARTAVRRPERRGA